MNAPTRRSTTSLRPICSVGSSFSAPVFRTFVPRAQTHHADFCYGGQLALRIPCATPPKWGHRSFVASVVQEVGSLCIGMAIIESGGAHTEFRCGSAQMATHMPIYDGTPANSALGMLDPKYGVAPKMARALYYRQSPHRAREARMLPGSLRQRPRSRHCPSGSPASKHRPNLPLPQTRP